MVDVAFFHDFVSPYAYLALTQARDFARRHGVQWDLRPVVYAKLLEAEGKSGPVETTSSRRHAYADVLRCADRLGVGLTGPPAHPFRSLEALRVATLFRDAPEALDLTVALAEAAWAEGRDLEDPDVRRDVVNACGLDATDLEERISAPAVKDALRAGTSGAVADGIFGVPTFVAGDELFWGHDRLEHLAAHLSGELAPTAERARALLERPGVRRPQGSGPGSAP